MTSTVTRRILSLISPVAVAGYKKTRLGNGGDGGYVLLDNFVDSSCCLSIGIGGDVSFDAALADRGYDVFQYDHTVGGPPTQHDRFRFSQIGLAPRGQASATLHDLDQIIADHNIRTYQRPILKIDIEDAEWDVLLNLEPNSIEIFDQICLEFHNLNRLSDADQAKKIEKAFRFLTQTHAPIHIHGNNWGKFHIVNGIPIPEVIELTYASKMNYVMIPSEEIFPGEHDTPNKPDESDLFLGKFQF